MVAKKVAAKAKAPAKKAAAKAPAAKKAAPAKPAAKKSSTAVVAAKPASAAAAKGTFPLPPPPHPDQLYIMSSLPGLEIFESKENGHRVYTYLVRAGCLLLPEKKLCVVCECVCVRAAPTRRRLRRAIFSQGYVVPRIEGSLEERCMGTIFWLAGAQEAKEFEDEQEGKKGKQPAAAKAAKPAAAKPAAKPAAKKSVKAAAAPKKSAPKVVAKASAKKAKAVAAKRK